MSQNAVPSGDGGPSLGSVPMDTIGASGRNGGARVVFMRLGRGVGLCGGNPLKYYLRIPCWS